MPKYGSFWDALRRSFGQGFLNDSGSLRTEDFGQGGFLSK
jgi:hypothetical protein